MTYKEIKDRLTKCEFTLNSIKNGTFKSTTKGSLKDQTQKLQIIKENLLVQLAEAERTAFINDKPVEYEKEDDLKKFKDNIDVKTITTAGGKNIKENIKFSLDETKAIAKKVGQAVAKALKASGDDIAHMKAVDIVSDSFGIKVEYKDGNMDNMSFYIADGKLMFPTDKEAKTLVDIGIKPSGEPIIQVDVLANELMKHFKSMNEAELDKGEKKKLKDMSKSLKKSSKGHAGQAKYIDKLVKEGEGDDHHYIKVPRMEFKSAERLLAKNIDGNHVKMDYTDDDGMGNVIIYFMFKDDAIASGEADSFMTDAVYDLQAHDINVQDHSAELDETVKETEGEKDMNEPDIDIGHVDDEPHMLQNTAYETTQYAAKLVKKLQKYNQHDGEVDFPNWWQSKLILAREYISSAYHYLDSKEKQPALDQLALEGDGMTTKIKPSEGDPTNMAYTDKVSEGRGDGDAINDIIISMANEDNISTREAAEEIIDHITHIFIDTKGTDEGKYKSDAQRKAIYATKAEKNEDHSSMIQAQYDDLTQVVKNIAHVGEMDIKDAAHNAVGHIEDEFSIDLDENLNEESLDKIYQGLAQVKKHIKTHLEMYKDAESPKNKQLAVNMLKKLNAQKKQLEKHLEDKVAGTGKDQELEIDEAGPGFKHDCAAKVVHEKYGNGTCIPEKHTLVKEGNKYVVTHYDVLFENGNTVLDIPVNELKIETTNEHWHKGYKKKKK